MVFQTGEVAVGAERHGQMSGRIDSVQQVINLDGKGDTSGR